MASADSGDARLELGVASLGGAPLEDLPSVENSRLWRFPPFLRWALGRPGPDERTKALRVAADVYRDSARRSSARSAVVVPIVASALIGEVFGVLRNESSYDHARYVANLNALPRRPWDRD